MHDAVAASRPTLRRTARCGVLAAIAIGVFVGAMSCAPGMASAGGHRSHARTDTHEVEHVEPGHRGHERPAIDDERTPSTRSDDDSTSVAVGQEHPGMACVMSVRLRIPDLDVPRDVRWADALAVVAPPDCVTEPEPPVPRLS